MTTYFTSDTHYGHANILKYCPRPYQTAEEMDAGLITNWNSVVQDDDIVYMLGDIFFCQAKEAKAIMRQLKGRKRLILGNHDKLIRNDVQLQKLFEVIYPDLHEETIDGIPVVMCHYPLLSWNRAFRGSFMLHGHSHNGIPFDDKFRRLDVGVDAQNYYPISWEDIKARLTAIDPTDARGR